MASHSWLGPRSVDGGLDEVPLPTTTGRLWLCGKHVVGPDPEAALARAEGATVVICLNEPHELVDRYPTYVDWLEHQEGEACIWEPIPDLHAPSAEQAAELASRIVTRLESGEGVIIHCGAGIGRAPTIAICVMMAMGVSASDATQAVATARPMAGPESGAQAELVRAFRP